MLHTVSVIIFVQYKHYQSRFVGYSIHQSEVLQIANIGDKFRHRMIGININGV